MPTVPQEQRKIQAEVAPVGAALPQLSGNVSQEAFGGGAAGRAIGEGFGKVAKTAEEIGEQFRKAAHESAMTGFDLELSQEQTRIEVAAKQIKGKDAAGTLDFIDSEWAKVSENLRKKAANGDQQAGVSKLLSARYQSLNRVGQTHAAAEMDAFDKVQSETYQKQVLNEALQNREDPERVGLALSLQAQEIERLGSRNGLTPEIIAAQKREVGSASRLAILNSYLDSDDPVKDSKAKAFFEQNRDFFLEGDKMKAHDLLEKGTLAGESQRASDKIFAETRSLKDAIEKTKSIQDPTLRDETTRRVKDLFALRELGEKDQEERLLKSAYDILDKTGDADKIPRSMWASFEGSQRSALLSYAKGKREGVDIPAAGPAYYELKLMAAQPETRNQFLGTNLQTYRGKMKDSELKELVDAQTEAKKNGKTDTLDGFLTDTQIANDAMAQINIKKDSDDAPQFRKKLDQMVAQKQKALGRKITGDELRALADEASVKVVTDKGWLWDTTKRAFELKEGDEIEGVKYDDIPKANRTEIENFLKSKKAPATSQAVEAFYAQMLRKKRGQ